MEMEPGEGKKHEMRETPEEETREGAEPDDMPMGKTSRKRSAKGAKNTKAPMDGGMYSKKPMDGEGCGCGGRKGKGKCDGNCGKKMDRNDALTPHEYLDACELGIQGRSRSYIRARLDAEERIDKKCGASGIPDNKKCRIGSVGSSDLAGKAKQAANTYNRKAGKGISVGKALLGAAVIGGGVLAAREAGRAIEEGNAKKEQLNRVNKLRQKGPAGKEAAQSLVNKYKESRPNSEARDRRAARNRKLLMPGVDPAPATKPQRRIRRQGKVVVLNSMYADGFAFDPALLGI